MKRNWKEYNGKLVRRGEIYISLDFLENWDEELSKMNKGKVGKAFLYSKSFMQFLAFIHIAFLPYRQIEGFLKKLSEYIPKLKATDYSTICKRLKKLEKLTDERVSDGKMLKPLVEDIRGRGGNVERVYADGGYDSRENFNYLAEIT